MIHNKLLSIPSAFDKKSIVHWLAFGFGSGLFKRAPGTCGSIAAVVFYILFLQQQSWLYIAIFVGFVLGLYLCGQTASDLGVHDHGGIVWDEFVGQWICLACLPLLSGGDAAWIYILCAFVLFRVFDILKPWPISWFDKKVSGGMGIMIDDVLAGLLAGITLYGLDNLSVL